MEWRTERERERESPSVIARAESDFMTGIALNDLLRIARLPWMPVVGFLYRRIRWTDALAYTEAYISSVRIHMLLENERKIPKSFGKQ